MMRIFDFLRRRKSGHVARDQVSVTDEAVTHTRPDGVQETVRWEELGEVSIVTTDQGPFQEDVFFVLISSDGKSGCAVPQSSEGQDRLLERLHELPGFDYNAAIEAMTSTSNAKFVCWKRDGASGSRS